MTQVGTFKGRAKDPLFKYDDGEIACHRERCCTVDEAPQEIARKSAMDVGARLTPKTVEYRSAATGNAPSPPIDPTSSPNNPHTSVAGIPYARTASMTIVDRDRAEARTAAVTAALATQGKPASRRPTIPQG